MSRRSESFAVATIISSDSLNGRNQTSKKKRSLLQHLSAGLNIWTNNFKTIFKEIKDIKAIINDKKKKMRLRTSAALNKDI